MKFSVVALLLLQGSFVSPQYYDIKKICTDRGVCNNNQALSSSQCQACYKEYEVYNDMYNKAKNLKPGDAGFAPTNASMYAGSPTPTSAAPAAQIAVSTPKLQANPLSLPTATAAAPVPQAASITPVPPGSSGIPNPVTAASALPAHASAALSTPPAVLPTAAPAQIASGSQAGANPNAQSTSAGASPTQTESLESTLLPTSTSATESNSTAPTSSETASSYSKKSIELTAVLSITTTLVLIGIGIGL
jgi:hypothetical protein